MVSKLPIGFDDVEKILRTVEHKLSKTLPILGLLKFVCVENGLSAFSKEQIRAHAIQHGEPYAATTFLDHVRRNPYAFLMMLVGLKKEDSIQFDIVWKSLSKHFEKREGKKKAVEDWINKKLKEIGDDDSGDDDDADGGNNDGGACARPSNHKKEPSRREPQEQNSSAKSGSEEDMQKPQHQQLPPRLQINQQQQQLPQPPQPQHASSPDSNLEQDLMPPVNEQLPAVGISMLQSHAFDVIARALEAPSIEHKRVAWEVLIRETREVQVSRNDQRKLRNSDEPGADLLDLLGDRNHTVFELGKWLQQCRLDGVYRTLLDNVALVGANNPGERPSSPPPPYKSAFESLDDNNLNLAIERTGGGQNQLGRNIPSSSSASDLPYQLLTKRASNSKLSNNQEPMIHPEQPQSANKLDSIDVNMAGDKYMMPRSTSAPACTPTRLGPTAVADSLNENLCSYKTTSENESMNQTTCGDSGSSDNVRGILNTSSDTSGYAPASYSVEAVDEGCDNTIKPPEQEMRELINDRVHQHDKDCDNLQSFIDKNQEQGDVTEFVDERPQSIEDSHHLRSLSEPTGINENSMTDNSQGPVEGQSLASRRSSSDDAVRPDDNDDVDARMADMESQNEQGANRSMTDLLPNVLNSMSDGSTSSLEPESSLSSQRPETFNRPDVVPLSLRCFSNNSSMPEHDSVPSMDSDTTENERTDVGGPINIEGGARNTVVANGNQLNEPEEKNLTDLEHVEDSVEYQDVQESKELSDNENN